MAYKFFDKVYKDWDTMVAGVMADYPEECHSSDASLDFIEENAEEIDDEPEAPKVPKCWICGSPLDGFVVPFLREKGVCSNYCLEDAGWDYS